MNSENTEYLNFNASHIISIELKAEVASNCKLRSNFVHEKLLETKNNLTGNPLLLKLCNKGLKFLNPDSQTIIMSHSIHRISYTACDRSSCQFAMVARSTENNNSQFCHIVRMCSVEEADKINRYIGSLFKDLHQKRKDRKSDSAAKLLSTPQKLPIDESSSQTTDSKPKLRPVSNVYDDLDTRLRRISTPYIDELVSEKHYVRRLSLCMPSPTSNEPVVGQGPQNLHSSLEKKSNFIRQIPQPIDNKPMLRKKTDYKPNKISAVIERLSFRASRDLSTDLLKSGSPVVALKEQLELSYRHSEKSAAHCSGEENRGIIPGVNSQSKKRFQPVLNDSANSWKLAALSRKNSAPIPLEQVANNLCSSDEQPPVPPIRINSLRNPIPNRPNALMDESPLVRCKRESSSQKICVVPQDQDDHLSSITTPSSCGDNQTDSYIDETRTSSIEMTSQFGKPWIQNNNKMNFSASFNDSQYRSFNHNLTHENHNSHLHLNYFKNLSKEETTNYLLDKELGSFILRNSASHQGCYALSVKVSDISISHYIIQFLSIGYQIKGLDKTWPNLHSLITHLSVIPEMLPCTLQLQQYGFNRKLSTPSFLTDTDVPITTGNHLKKQQTLPQSKSAEEEYQHRMKYFLNDSSIPSSNQEQYQQLSDFSSMIASFDLN